MMKNIIIPVIMSEKESLRPNIVDISVAPFCKNTIRKEVSTI